jgi:hypothetical protein
VINPHNGFFAHDGGFMNSAYYAGIGITAAVLLILTFVDIRRGCGILSNVEKAPKKSAKREVADVLAEIMTDVATGAKKVLPQRAWTSEMPMPVALFGGILLGFCGFSLALRFSHEASSGTALPLALLGAAALGYTFTAYAIIAYRKFVPIIAIAFLFIAGFSASEAAFEFMKRSYTANLSSRLILLSASLLIAVFLLSAGRIIVRSETRFTAYSATVSGYLGASLILSDFAARLIYHGSADAELQSLLADRGAVSGFELPDPMFITQGLVILWVIFALSVKAKAKEVETSEEVENIENIEDFNKTVAIAQGGESSAADEPAADA